MSVALGIDLGTTNSVAAIATPTGVEFILGARGERVHPSVVAFPTSGGVVVGADAKRYRLTEPHNVIHSAKRFIGQNIARAAGPARADRRALQGRGGPEPAADRRDARSPDDDARDLVARAAPPQARRGAPARHPGPGRGDHGAGELHRRAAPGDQGGRPARRARRDAPDQRADRGRARLRLRPRPRADDLRVRLRRRHVRRLGAPASAARSSRCSRRRATSSSAATTSTARSPRSSRPSCTACCGSIRGRTPALMMKLMMGAEAIKLSPVGQRGRRGRDRGARPAGRQGRHAAVRADPRRSSRS